MGAPDSGAAEADEAPATSVATAEPAAEPVAEPTTAPPAATVATTEDEQGVTTAGAASAAPAVAGDSPDVASEAPPKWTDDLSFGAFVDAYVGFNTNMPRPQGGNNALRAFDSANGFSLAWAGLNTSYEGERAGATVDLRFGPATNAGWSDDAIPGIQHVKQGYATWNALPEGKLTFDFGRFDTIYGAEVAESWNNHTYTRGALYNLAQPFWHTGLRVSSQLNDTVAINGLLVNGWGHIVDNNAAKSVGLQLGLTPGKGVFGLYVGYLGGAESDDVDELGVSIEGANWDLRHLADVVMTVDLRRLSLAFNADYVFDDTPAGPQQWAGAMASARFQATDWLGLAARGEYLFDPDGFMSGAPSNTLATGTLTADFKPAKMLTLRFDARGDASQEAIFSTGTATPSADPEMPTPPELRQFQLTFTLGMVVHSF
ncbi:MAG: outer membrane beta-barrel protein [Myxococcota bacterium]